MSKEKNKTPNSNQMWHPEPAQRILNISEYYFSHILEKIRIMNEDGPLVINLGIGSPDLSPSTETIDAAVDNIKLSTSHGYTSYRSTLQLRQAFSNWYQKVYNVALNSNHEVLPLLGSKEGIHYISMALLNPNDEVLVPNPGYLAYTSATRIAGAKPIPYELTEEKKWWPQFDKLEQMDLRKVKLMWANYPHMPTGTKATAELFKNLISFAQKNKILICHDNPYSQTLNTSEPLSILCFDQQKQYSLELNSLSKSFNMAGWRVGVLAANKTIIDYVLQVKSNVDSGMFLPIQMASIQALSNSADWHAERNNTYRKRRALVFKIFEKLNFKINPDQEGLFVWAKAPDQCLNVENFCHLLLEKCRVFITPGHIFGSAGLRYARISLCANENLLLEALSRIESFLKNYDFAKGEKQI